MLTRLYGQSPNASVRVWLSGFPHDCTHSDEPESPVVVVRLWPLGQGLNLPTLVEPIRNMNYSEKHTQLSVSRQNGLFSPLF